MRGKKLTSASILAIAIVIATMVGTTAATTTKLSVTPGNLGMLYAGDTFTISITVEDVVGLSSYDFKLVWDAFVIRPLEVSQGPFLSQDGMYSTFFLYKIEMTYDRMIAGEMMMGPQTTSGSGTLATITFVVVGAGGTSIDLYASKLLDIDVVNMPHSEFDGHASGHMVAEINSCWPEASRIPVEDESVCLSAEIANLGEVGTVRAWVEFIGFDMGGTMFVYATDKVEIPQGETCIVENCDFNATAFGAGVYKVYTRCYYEYTAGPVGEFYARKEKQLKFQVV
jgi:hypothetical protein